MLLSRPRVTVGLPVYNGENFLEDAIDSILAQTYRDFRLIIADNASTDRTEEICRRYAAADSRIDYCRHPQNIGAARNFNFVFLHSDSEYFKWAAHDDVVGRDYLRLCVERMDADRSLAICHTRSAVIDAERRIIGSVDGGLPLNGKRPSERFCRILWSDYFCEVWGLMRSSMIRQTRLYGSFVGSDRSFMTEMLLQGDVAYLPAYEFYRRDHNECFSKIRAAAERDRWFDPDKTVDPILARVVRKLIYLFSPNTSRSALNGAGVVRGLRYLMAADLAVLERAVCIGSLMNRVWWRGLDALRRCPGRYRPRYARAEQVGGGPVPEPPPRNAFATLAGAHASGGGA